MALLSRRCNCGTAKIAGTPASKIGLHELERRKAPIAMKTNLLQDISHVDLARLSDEQSGACQEVGNPNIFRPSRLVDKTLLLPGSDAAKAQAALWRSGLLCDVTLRTPQDGTEIPCHRLALASASGYFRALFTGAGACMAEGGSPVVHMGDLSAADLQAALTAMYDLTVQIGPGNLESLLHTASYLEMPLLLDACAQYMRGGLGAHSCVPLLLLASRYALEQLRAEAVAYICSRFSTLASGHVGETPGQQYCPETRTALHAAAHSGQAHQNPHARASPLVDLPSDLLIEVLSSDELSVESERDVLQLILDWTAHRFGGSGAETQEAARQLPQLLASVRLEHLPHALGLSCPSEAHQHALGVITQLLSVPRPEPPPPAAGTAPAPAPAAAWQLLGGRGRPRRHKASALLAVGGYDHGWRSLRSAEVYDPLLDSWAPGPALTLSALGFAACAAADKGEVYLVGGSPFRSEAARLAPPAAGAAAAWEACPAPLVARAHAGVVAAGGGVLALGGRSQVAQVQHLLRSVEVYLPGRPAWERGPDMNCERSALACAALYGQVFAIGGAAQRVTHRSVELFDPGAERWLPLAVPLTMERKYTAAGVLGGRLYVAGGVNEQRTRLSSVEAMDPREGKWQVVAHMAAPRSSCGVAALQERLYFVGGQAGDTSVHDLVECLEPSTMTFRRCAPLGCGRSSLGLCALPGAL